MEPFPEIVLNSGSTFAMKRPWQNFHYGTQGSASWRIAMVSSIWLKLNKYFQMKD